VNAALIAAMEAKAAAQRVAGDTEAVVKAGMRATYGHWAALDEDDQFKAAIVGVSGLLPEEEQERLRQTLESLRDLSALLSGVPVDLAVLTEGIETRDPPLPLLRWWHEIKTEEGCSTCDEEWAVPRAAVGVTCGVCEVGVLMEATR
jgi:hypothetical protein